MDGEPEQIACEEGIVHLWRTGRGTGRPLVLLHNGGADHRIWDAQIPTLARRHDVVAVDLLGFGESDKPDIPYCLDLYCRTLRRVVSTLGLERPVLVGNCIGAATALEYASHHPGEVRALVLFHVCGGRTMLRRSLGLGFNAPAWKRPFFLASAWLMSHVGFLQRAVTDRLFASPRRELPIYRHLQAQQRAAWHRRSRWNLTRGLDSFNKFAPPYVRPDGLPPTFLLWGAANRVFSLACGRGLASSLRPDRYDEVPNAGHLAMSEDPERVNAFLEEFLNAV